MARMISKPHNNFFNCSFGASTSTFRTYAKHHHSKSFLSERRFKHRVYCCVKETEREDAAQAKRILSGLEVNGQLEEEESVGEEVGLYRDWPPWKDLPQRYKLIGTTSLAFVICNMDKVNLSIAIIPMSHQFGWNASVAGLVQSSFFWGYALSQLPGGWLAKLFGGSKVLEVGVLAWSLATALVPIVAGFMPGLIFSRILVGIGEGVSPSAATDMIAMSIPIEERSRAVAFVFGGLSVGSVLGLSVFQFVKEDRRPFREAYLSWPQSGPMNKSWKSSLEDLGGSLKDIPWKEFFKSKAVWAMIYTHFCGSWGHYTCLSWLPTYFSEELDLDFTEAAWVSVLPPLASIFVTGFASQFADSMIAKGVETTVVRKICQTIAFLSPATCMILSSVDLGLSPWEVVSILTGGLALSSFALSGLYCTHQDMSPEYASVLLGITNTVGAVPGIIGVALTGYLLDSTHSWGLSLFAPSIFFYITGTIVWLTLASSKPQTFEKSD
ncbi:Probable anion transporter 6- chloroplastic [Striga hermonthica]|uniref:Probable anion transporter 6- chloroplastic n=1 Tax=Striga hermonthica TaxID=68872 RepID=A0A9N7N0T0_STRHE|nr:Probable anion transporter 6- chloroplastic [Striga hermonthica]